jgi:hypothetical protein
MTWITGEPDNQHSNKWSSTVIVNSVTSTLFETPNALNIVNSSYHYRTYTIT